MTLLHEIHAMVREQRVEIGHIKEQTTKTNGRVNKAEDQLDTLSSFQTKVMTVWGIAIAVASLALNKFL